MSQTKTLCPYCKQTLPDEDAEICPHCDSDLVPPSLTLYEAPLAILEKVAQAQKSKMTAPKAQELFSHLMGVVQQTLDIAREDISENLRKAQSALEDLPDDAKKGTVHYSEEFGRVQSIISERLMEIADLCGDDEMQSKERTPRMEAAVGKFKADLGELENLVRETSQPEQMKVPLGPLPKEVFQAIEHFSKCMEHINIYCAGRQKIDLEPALTHLEEARRLLRITLMIDVYE